AIVGIHFTQKDTNMKVIFIALIQCISIIKGIQCGLTRPFLAKTTIYETILNGKILRNADITTVFVDDALECLRECNKLYTCVSVNFNIIDTGSGGKECMLNKELIAEESELQDDISYQFIQMSKQNFTNFRTHCSREGGTQMCITCPESTSLRYPYYNYIYNGHCYWFGAIGRTNGTDAAVRCQEANGYLVSINDEAEHTFLASIAVKRITTHGGQTYIGLPQKSPTENIHDTWADGTPVEFSRWRTGYPSSVDDACAILESSSALWRDYGCDVTRPYICETPAVAVSLDGPYYLQPYSDGSSYIGLQNTDQLWLSNHLNSSQAFYFQSPGITWQNGTVTLFSDDNTGNMMRVVGGPGYLQNWADRSSNGNFAEETTFTLSEDEFFPDFVTLRIHGKYMVVSNGQLVSQAFLDTDAFKSSASFKLIAAP
ncbi:unnamed protein product, partial [Owenia fusiformis]